MVGLAEGAQYLIEYPYGCAEQRSSAAMATMLAGDLGDAFALPGLDAKKARSIAQATIYELYKFQCGDGGFSFWPGECSSESPYLTANVLHVMQRGVSTLTVVLADIPHLQHGGSPSGLSLSHRAQRQASNQRALQDQIARSFLVISQVPVFRYAQQTPRFNRLFFPERNVTMSALTEATIIVEAGETSGTLTPS